MPEYLFYRIDEDGSPLEVIGKREAANASTGYHMLAEQNNLPEVEVPDNVEAAIVTDTLSAREMRSGYV